MTWKKIVCFILNQWCFLLDHIENLLSPVKPDIMVWYGHGLECNFFGILEVRIRSVKPRTIFHALFEY